MDRFWNNLKKAVQEKIGRKVGLDKPGPKFPVPSLRTVPGPADERWFLQRTGPVNERQFFQRAESAKEKYVFQRAGPELWKKNKFSNSWAGLYKKRRIKFFVSPDRHYTDELFKPTSASLLHSCYKMFLTSARTNVSASKMCHRFLLQDYKEKSLDYY